MGSSRVDRELGRLHRDRARFKSQPIEKPFEKDPYPYRHTIKTRPPLSSDILNLNAI